ncbi:rhamnogalacturonan acetylesterase [Desmospora activa]|uniref:Lysophospholipase L1-like esterase n=1 Tax=Desmospora activa DSM 45169 TaxID=1121389 RepID=A0A2T4Z3U8_9BACL|nr:rhamnogalacturonan acetylesterase [Desmospora activa]PTM56570.1 lysophospholipase L1-like esterase [Desmospora activa DSM 45169]
MGKSARLFLIGDSTVSDYPHERAPMAGWGQMLPAFVNDGIEVHNHALCGRSSKSFHEEGHFAAVEQGMQEGDLLLIQFGHNDAKQEEARYTDPDTSYVSYLQGYVDAARKKGALPLLVTPVRRRTFDEEGELKDCHGKYPGAMARLAQSEGVPLLDLEQRTAALFISLGPEKSKHLFTWLEPGQHRNYPNGLQDDTHFNETGAHRVAELVASGLQHLGQPYRSFISGRQLSE